MSASPRQLILSYIGQLTHPATSYVLRDAALACTAGAVLGLACLISPMLSLVLLMGCTLLLVALVKPQVLAYLAIPAIIFSSGMPRGAIVPYLRPNELFLLLSVGTALPVLIVKHWRQAKVYQMPQIGLVVLLAGTGVVPLIAYLARGSSLSIQALFALLGPVQFFPLLWIFSNLAETDRDRWRLMRVIFACSSLVAAIGLAQAAGIGPVIAILRRWYTSSQLEQAAEVGRVTSVMGSWNGLGTLMMLTLLLIAGLLPNAQKRSDQLFMAAVGAICAACLLATNYYTGLIALTIGSVIIAILSKPARRYLLPLPLLLPLLAIPLREQLLHRLSMQFGGGGILPQTFAYRIEVWRDVFWPLIQESWLWGFAPVFPANLSWGYAESQYINLLLVGGIWALLTHLLWVLMTLRWAFRMAFSSRTIAQPLATSLFAAVTAMSIMGITNAVFTYSGTNEYLWMISGLIGGAERTKA